MKEILCEYELIGFSYAFPKLIMKTDILHGLYIYYMTVVNVMITLGMTGKVYYMMLLCYPDSAFHKNNWFMGIREEINQCDK